MWALKNDLITLNGGHFTAKLTYSIKVEFSLAVATSRWRRDGFVNGGDRLLSESRIWKIKIANNPLILHMFLPFEVFKIFQLSIYFQHKIIGKTWSAFFWTEEVIKSFVKLNVSQEPSSPRHSKFVKLIRQKSDRIMLPRLNLKFLIHRPVKGTQAHYLAKIAGKRVYGRNRYSARRLTRPKCMT